MIDSCCKCNLQQKKNMQSVFWSMTAMTSAFLLSQAISQRNLLQKKRIKQLNCIKFMKMHPSCNLSASSYQALCFREGKYEAVF